MASPTIFGKKLSRSGAGAYQLEQWPFRVRAMRTSRNVWLGAFSFVYRGDKAVISQASGTTAQGCIKKLEDRVREFEKLFSEFVK